MASFVCYNSKWCDELCIVLVSQISEGATYWFLGALCFQNDSGFVESTAEEGDQTETELNINQQCEMEINDVWYIVT